MNRPDLSLAVESVEKVYQAASNLFTHVRRRLEDIKATWTLYSKQGIVPETDVFDKLEREIREHLQLLQRQKKQLCKYIQQFNRHRLTPDGQNIDWQQVPDSCNPAHWGALCEVKKLLFNSILLYSEALTYLTQHLSSRAGTLTVSEATHGSSLTMHRFSGVQAVYDAAEALMSDYASSLGNDNYSGLVVFGYDFQAAAWKSTLTTFPLFAEHPPDLPMLVILAHEAAHWLQANDPMESVRKRIIKRLARLVETYDGFSFIPLLGPVSVDFHPRFHPTDSSFRRLAGEVVSDVFATLIAGPAYPRILARYFLPFHVDSVIASANPISPDPKNISWDFYVSSFKLRVATETAQAAGFIEDEEASAIGEYARLVEWALTNIAANHSRKIPENSVLKAALKESFGINKLPEQASEVLNAIRDNIEDMARDLVRGNKKTGDGELSKTIVEIFQECIECTKNMDFRPYAFIDAHTGSSTDDLSRLRQFFQGDVSFRDVLNFWKDHNEWRPRHLISLLVPPFYSKKDSEDSKDEDSEDSEDSEINRFAIILALAHHPSIISRYQRIHMR